MIQRLLILVTTLWATAAWGQDYAPHWISHPTPDSLSHIWFRHTYLAQGRAAQAHITLTTTGYAKLYVNECNIGTALFYPYRHAGSDEPMTITVDVTPYLRADTNVVAVMYAPSHPHVDPRQIAVSFYGRMPNGQPFGYHSNADWLCRRANSRMKKDGGEYIDGRQHNPSWKASAFDAALWVGATEQPTPYNAGPALPVPCAQAHKVIGRRGYEYFDNTARGTDYEFGKAFYGLVRLTIREAVRGQRISVGRTDYICNGSMDEQAASCFLLESLRQVTVTGDRHYRRELVTDIEAIETAPTWVPGADF